MEVFIKKFDELSVDELWQIYRLRMAVFVIEQECIYQDIDEFDKVAYHVFFTENNEITAYLRVLPSGTVFDTPSIGRVIAVKRRCGLGSEIVRQGIAVAQKYFNAKKITIEAQTYVKSMYEKLGFVQTSEEFLEDGIPHIKMELDINEIR